MYVQKVNAVHELRVIHTRLRVQRILLSVIKIEKETPRTRDDYTVQELILYMYQELAVQG